MKLFKKITLTLLVIIIVALSGGYFYFDRKFTPEENYLSVTNESGKIPLKWLGTHKNVLLLPITIPGDTATYYMQFDTGSPYTLFYNRPVKDITGISKAGKDRVKATFLLGNTTIASDKFKTFSSDEKYDGKNPLKIIGTLGADVLEGRKTLLNFKENHLVFNLSDVPQRYENNLIDFSFKKRHIMIPATLGGKERKFLFDSGTSAYELLTNKEEWDALKLPGAAVNIEKVQSWKNVLTAFTAQCDHSLLFKNKKVPLKEVTYVEGFSKAQYSLMKFSGMTGMLGNKIFLNNCLYIDCTKNKIGID